jgi:Asp-tRNA(Asn)/Glu-tRNA(Gln) amidotransferase A subunit family amidase
MTEKPLRELAALVAQGEVSAEAVAQAWLERATAREATVQAFVHFDPAQTLADARKLDAEGPSGPLAGIPVGVKDVIDTFDRPTEYGSPIYQGNRPKADASVVAMTRKAGGLVFTKTVTTEFATFPPGPTTNPHNPEHTPGGSSSGSAAAVGGGMLPAAFGTQTTGSIIRPASFCGAVGYKPTYNTLSRIGVKAISDILDTVGTFTRTVEDAAYLVASLTGRPELAKPSTESPRLAVCLTPYWDAALPETQQLFERITPKIGEEVELPKPFAGLNDAQDRIWMFEMARCLADEHRRHREQIREPLRGQLDGGWQVPHEEYQDALALARRCRRLLADALGDFDALVVPSAPGEAPKGTGATGNPMFNRMWSVLHGPAIHVPLSKGPNGLPIGVQVVGRIGDDARVLAAAQWVERHLR